MLWHRHHQIWCVYMQCTYNVVAYFGLRNFGIEIIRMLKSLYCNRRKYDMYPSHTQCNKRIIRKSKQLKIKNHKKNFVFFPHSPNSLTATLSIPPKGFSIKTRTLCFLLCSFFLLSLCFFFCFVLFIQFCNESMKFPYDWFTRVELFALCIAFGIRMCVRACVRVGGLVVYLCLGQFRSCFKWRPSLMSNLSHFT